MNKFIIDWQYGGYTGITTFLVGSHSPNAESDYEWLDIQSFWIFDGNFACDCNRRSIIDYPVIKEFGHACGDDIIFHNVDFYRGDRYIGSGCDTDWFEWWGEEQGDYTIPNPYFHKRKPNATNPEKTNQ